MTVPKPLVLCILDGWGLAPPSNANAISLARKPVYDAMLRDFPNTLLTNGASYMEQLLQKMREYGVGKVASVSGRYYAMDRDRRWPRIKLAFDAMVKGKSEAGSYQDPVKGIKESYNKGVTDEFII